MNNRKRIYTERVIVLVTEREKRRLERIARLRNKHLGEIGREALSRIPEPKA